MKYTLKISSHNIDKMLRVMEALRDLIPEDNPGYIPVVSEEDYPIESEVRIESEPEEIIHDNWRAVSAEINGKTIEGIKPIIHEVSPVVEEKPVSPPDRHPDQPVPAKKQRNFSTKLNQFEKDLKAKPIVEKKPKEKKQRKSKDPVVNPAILATMAEQPEIIEKRICIVCSKEFEPASETSRTCSKTCYMKNYFHPERYSKSDNPTSKNRPWRSIDDKLDEIKRNYPAPMSRPERTRDFS
jgi:hypothetical protein